MVDSSEDLQQDEHVISIIWNTPDRMTEITYIMHYLCVWEALL